MKVVDVRFCGGCGKVEDESKSLEGRQVWTPLHAYRMKHGFLMTDLKLVKTYCPDCSWVVRLATGRETDSSRS